MSGQYTLKISDEQAKEMPMVDLAYEVLKGSNTPLYYRDLMQEIAKIKGISDDEVMQVIAQLYTEINIDGRFACVGTNLWGLKRWYPVEKAEDPMGAAKRPRIINDEDDDLEDEDLFGEEEDDEEEYDAEDNDGEELFDEAEEEEFDENESVDEEEEAEELDEDGEAELDEEDNADSEDEDDTN